MSVHVERFEVAIPEAVLEDLHERIRRTRWPDPAPGEPWSQGADLDYLRELLAYWADGFDWRAPEARLNGYEHRLADVDGVTVHYVHHRAPVSGGAPGAIAGDISAVLRWMPTIRSGCDSAM